MSNTKYNQLVGDIDDIEFLLEENDEILNENKKKKKKKTKSKWFDDGTSVKQNTKKYTRHRAQKDADE